MGYLVLIDRCYRGGLETQFFDPFYGVLGLRAQVGAVEVVLRGDAVTAAVAAAAPPELTLGGAGPDLTPGGAGPDLLPDPRASVRAMVGAGIVTYADEPALRAFGLDAGSLLPGVTCLDSTELALRWTEYDGVWFL